jgi:hypothetical protein
MNKKINEETAQAIIDEFVAGLTNKELADKYSLSDVAISKIIRGKCWINCIRPVNLPALLRERVEATWYQKGHSDELHATYPKLTDRQTDILIGSLLGDGDLYKTSEKQPNSCFRKPQCLRHRDYLEWHHDELLPFSKPLEDIFSKEIIRRGQNGIVREKADKHLSGYRFHTCYHPFFTALRDEWYPDGRKIVPDGIKLNELRLAVWFCDDGHNDVERRQASLATNAFTVDEAEKLIALLKCDLGIESTIYINKSAVSGESQPRIYVKHRSYKCLIDMIKPFIVFDCMKKKIAYRDSITRRKQ